MSEQGSSVQRRHRGLVVGAAAPPPRVDLRRRQLVIGLGLLPAATMGLGFGREAWALESRVEVAIGDGVRIVRSNAIPDHPTGRFPNRRNPNAIRAQSLEFRMPLAPRTAGRYTLAQGWNFGVAVNGVPFDPFTAEFWNGDPRWSYDAIAGFVDLGLDENHAHVQPGGKYHYHGWPTGLVKAWSPNAHSPIVGWAADGFPIYAAYGHAEPGDPASPIRALASGWRVKAGPRPAGGPGGDHDGRFFADWEWQAGRGDLDRANGREGVTPDFPGGTYAYFLTEDWPVIPRHFAGTPDASFAIGRGPGGPGGPSGPGGAPGRPSHPFAGPGFPPR